MSAEYEDDRVPREDLEANWPGAANEPPEEFDDDGQAAAVGAIAQPADSSLRSAAHQDIASTYGKPGKKYFASDAVCVESRRIVEGELGLAWLA